MKKNFNEANSVKTLERDLKIASSILEWEMGDIWGHIGVRLPGGKGIMVKSIRPPAGEEERKDWIVRFDYSGRKNLGRRHATFRGAYLYPDLQSQTGRASDCPRPCADVHRVESIG